MRRLTVPVVLAAISALIAGCSLSLDIGESHNAQAASIDLDDAAVWAIGDSLMVGSQEQLEAAVNGIDVDAEVGRTFKAGLDLLSDKLASEPPPDVLIFALGTNNGATDEQIGELVDTASAVDRIVLVNVVVPRGWEANTNQAILSAAAEFPKVVFVDWSAASNGNGSLFRSDGYHLNEEGAGVWVDLISDATH